MTMIKSMAIHSLAVSFLLLIPCLILAETHKFTPQKGYPTFAKRPPVFRVKPGDTLITSTLWGEWYERAGGAWPGEVGPIEIEGATPDDILVVKILKLAPNHDTAVSTHRPGLSALTADRSTPMLNDPVPSQRFVWKLDLNTMTGTLPLPNSRAKSITVPLDPMLGRVATAPPGEESWGGLWPGEFGGNMDVPDIKEGATVYLPVFHPGALFYFGDGHALQGDGEICGSGLETAMDVTFQFDLIKNRKIQWPRIENSDYLMTTGSVRPLMDAFRIAHVELVLWLTQDYGFDKWEAFQLVSQLGTARIGNVVDPNYCVVAKFPKKYLGR
jgi:amidase